MRSRYALNTWLMAIVIAGWLDRPVWAIDWPQWMGPARDGVWRETGLIEKFPPGGPKVLWRLPVGMGYSGPAVASGRVYVMDREISKSADGKPLKPTKEGIPGNERLLCIDEVSGKLIWKDEYDCPYKVSYPMGPRTTPLVHGKRVYALGAMGDLRCLECDSGKLIWAKNLAKKYKVDSIPVWGWSGHPLIEGDLLYCLVGGKGSAVMAFNKDTGKEVWRALTTEEIGYSPPMIYEAGGKRQLIIWLSEAIHGLNPATGEVYWKIAYPSKGKPRRPAVNIITVRRSNDLLFLSTFYHGPMMLKFAADKPQATVLWQGKSNDVAKPDGVHSLMATPAFKDGYLYGVCANGELRCLKADDGKQQWETCAPAGGQKETFGTTFLIPQGDRFVLFNDHGELILANLSPKGYEEIDRAQILKPVQESMGRKVVWSHPAFADKCVFARNDKEIVCVSMATKQS